MNGPPARRVLSSFLEVPVAQRVSHVPPDAEQDHVDRATHPFEVMHVDLSSV
jgi:hypothetical protein